MSIVRINDLGQGANFDLMPEELTVGVWSGCTNVRFQNGFAQRFGGMSNVFDTPAVVPYFIMPYVTQNTKYWVHAGVARVYVDDGSTRTDITPASPFTGTQDDRWSGSSLNGVLIMNNSVDQPVYWGGNPANDLATLPGWDANWRAKVICAFKDFIFVGNVTKSGTSYPSMVKWSAAADPGAVPASWDENDVTLDAGEQDLAETPDVVIDMMVMGDQLIVYKTASMYSVSLIGNALVFRFQKLPGSDGILARGCVADTPLGHVVLTPNDVVIHQGQGARSIANGYVKNFLFSNINKTISSRAFVCTNPPSTEVLICYPSTSSETCDSALVWNWSNGKWSFRTLTNVTYGQAGQIDTDAAFFSWAANTNTWATETRTWAQTDFAPYENRLLFSRDTAITAFDIGVTDFGNTVNASIERTGLSFDNPYSVKLLKAVYPVVDAPAGTVVKIRAGGAMVATENPTYSDYANFTVGTDQKVDLFASGRYLALEFSSDTDAVWKARSAQLDMSETGAY